MQKDKQFRVIDRWALATDGVQWILQRQSGSDHWQAVSFVRTTREILARRMREKGVPALAAEQLLKALPEDFETWHDEFYRFGGSPTAQTEKIVMEGPVGLYKEAA